MPPTGDPNAIQSLIAARGPIPFRDFMALALYHPVHGYYASGRALVGRAGDFFTNVSVGSTFGELIALQFQEMWDLLGQPHPFNIVEQGANDATFALDVLAWCKINTPSFYDSLRYEIIEPLDLLKSRQKSRLAPFPGKAHWHPALDALPPFTGVHFSNELIDSFPVHLVRWRQMGWQELYVTPDLTWIEVPLQNSTLLDLLADVPRLEGYTTEVHIDALQWAGQVAPKIDRGWLLAIDYGFPRPRYYAPERHAGTLQSYTAHTKALDPLSDPGFRDITAHVEFTSLARALRTAGLQVAGYTDQHHFLTALIPRAFPNSLPSPQQTRHLKTLLHPEMLGASFQVLAMSRNVPSSLLAGFQYARPAARELALE